jgi:hypothetical protein
MSHLVEARAGQNVGEWRTVGSLDDVEAILSRGELPQRGARSACEHQLDVVSAARRRFRRQGFESLCVASDDRVRVT